MSLPETGEMPLHTQQCVAWGVYMWRVLAMLVIVSMLVHWGWVLFEPRSISALPAVIPALSSHTEQLFGGVRPVSKSAIPSVMPGIRLVGVFAGVPGFAVFELDRKRQLGVATGHEIVAGTKLVNVANDHVVIERDGVPQQILLVTNNLKKLN
jgi:hypothetical protein